MKRLQFICTLHADLIFNQKTATEGNQQTLDYIPGSTFLGLVAGKLYNHPGFPSLEVFHSGRVQFGDAHPLIDNKRSYRLPAWWYYPKGGELEDGIFTPYFKDESHRLQTKQCRAKFAVFNNINNTFTEYELKTRFAIKSAYDSEKRRAEDKKMYGYQSMVKGSVWCFEIRYDENQNLPIDEIRSALVGENAIGKSKSAEYGLVTIEEKPFETFNARRTLSNNHCLLYAESRLVFLDNNGQPTYLPDAAQLGFQNGEIDWAHSQIRTFQYASFNGKRQTRDADKFGIEKGSVIYVKKTAGEPFIIPTGEESVGCFKNEGFGRILYDPAFLESNAEQQMVFSKAGTYKHEPDINGGAISADDEVILEYLRNAKNETNQYNIIYKAVNKFVEKNYVLFNKEKFASQWGTIRTLTIQSRSKQELLDNLFGEGGYLVHGIAAEKWSVHGRLKRLREFIEDLNDANVLNAVVNLSSEMAKKCRREAN
ncbi:MAG: hypothetical protein PHX54_01195 [Lentimicrobiaceae bacterium]|nr:hypothetical protein [Lentimicrobiaceae bacterium]